MQCSNKFTPTLVSQTKQWLSLTRLLMTCLRGLRMKQAVRLVCNLISSLARSSPVCQSLLHTIRSLPSHPGRYRLQYALFSLVNSQNTLSVKGRRVSPVCQLPFCLLLTFTLRHRILCRTLDIYHISHNRICSIVLTIVNIIHTISAIP